MPLESSMPCTGCPGGTYTHRDERARGFVIRGHQEAIRGHHHLDKDARVVHSDAEPMCAERVARRGEVVPAEWDRRAEHLHAAQSTRGTARRGMNT